MLTFCRGPVFWKHGVCIEFHQNRPNFVEDINKNVLVSFFRTHCVHYSALETFVTMRCINLHLPYHTIPL